MMTLRKLGFALLLAVLAAVPAAARETGSIAITPGSANAAIILKAELLTIPPAYRTSYRISLQSYDPAEQKLLGGPFGGQAVFAARRDAFVDGYMVLEIRPGTYTFRDLSRQDFWSLCFHDASLQFTVRPGEVVYLGEMDVRLHVGELERMSLMTGRTTARSGQSVQFFDGVTPPTLAPVDEAGLAAVATMMRANMPRTTVAPRAATFTPARFGTGRDLFGTQRLCGGYYAGRAR